MSWTTITAELLQRKMPADWVALKRVAEGQQRMDWDATVQEVIESVVNEVRGYIAAFRTNRLGAEGTVPPELVRVTVIKCRLELIAIIPGGTTMADALRVSLEKRANETLEAVAKGTFGITPPDTSPAAQPDAAAPRIGGDRITEWPDTVTDSDTATRGWA